VKENILRGKKKKKAHSEGGKKRKKSTFCMGDKKRVNTNSTWKKERARMPKAAT